MIDHSMLQVTSQNQELIESAQEGLLNYLISKYIFVSFVYTFVLLEKLLGL